ncbi:hypothetical protein Q7P36_008882 [Cladosporium allicinum]
MEVQICPNPKCKKLIGLKEGCNHVICGACTQNFCFICGNEARDHSGHWAPGGCPRFGARGAPRAIYHPQPNTPHDTPAVDPDDAFMTDTHIMHWNVAMQTLDLEAQNILRRFVEGTGIEITEEDRTAALAALETYNPLSGFSEAEWHAPRASANRRARGREFLEMLVIIRGAEMMRLRPAPPQDTPSDNHIYADVGPLINMLRAPIPQVFNMSTTASRDTAYDWVAARLRLPDNRTFGDLAPEDSAILSEIPLAGASEVIELFNNMNRRLRAVRFSLTSVLLTVRGDFFGPVVPLPFARVNHVLGMPEHFAEEAQDFRWVLNNAVWHQDVMDFEIRM